MKGILLIFLLVFLPSITLAQYFRNHFKIGQSTEILENDEEDPAQSLITFPTHGSAHYLLDFGVKYNINGRADSFVSKFLGEYHKKTLVDSMQNNAQFGYAWTWNVSGNYLFNTGDIKYVWDGIDSSNSLVGDILFHPRKNNGNFHINVNSIFNTTSFLFSVYGGAQVQQIFSSEKEFQQGLVIRPMLIVNANFNVLKNNNVPIEPLIRISVLHTSRYASLNTSESGEFYTQLSRFSIEYFLASDPLDVSLGLSYNVGSDPSRGLKNQSYFLVSLNCSL